ncbi:MAG: Uncharacterised protein [Flavobacteriales bacterium UBA4585]|nr:MAG: Uncharacterised protein [Flavobacteriales bacterium UBA4585]
MRRIKEFYWRRGLRNAVPSKCQLKNATPKVTVLTSNLDLVAVVKEHFSTVDFVYFEDMKRPREEATKTFHLYRDDFNFKGEPKRHIPEPGDNHLLLNLEQNPANLTWYWSARCYDIRVDLCGTYDNADLSIANPNVSLKEQLVMLKKMLNVMTTNE